MVEDLVSIITPMYNAEKYIAETIASVQAQTYEKWEMLIVDDASTDGSASIVQKMMMNDERIKYYKNSVNCGVAQSRNIAISKARGRFLAFLDSDDLWRPVKLEEQLQMMKESGSAFCYGACSVIDETGKSIRRDRYVPEKIDYKELLKGNVIPCLTVVIDHKRIPDIIMPQIPHEDYATWLTILKEGIVACGINEVVADYRVCRDSVSSHKGSALKWTWNIYRNYLNLNLCACIYNFCWYAIRGLGKHVRIANILDLSTVI